MTVDDFTPGFPCFQYSFPYCNEEFDSPSLASGVFVIIDAFFFVVVILVLYNAFAEAALSDLVPAYASILKYSYATNAKSPLVFAEMLCCFFFVLAAKYCIHR